MRFFVAYKDKENYKIAIIKRFEPAFIVAKGTNDEEIIVHRQIFMGCFPANGMTHEQAEAYANATLKIFPDINLYNGRIDGEEEE